MVTRRHAGRRHEASEWVAVTIACAAMAKVSAASSLPVLVAVGVVLFAFWPALLGGGSFVPGDVVIEHSAPFDSYKSEGFFVESSPGESINIHSHWAPLAEDVRSGEVGWWNPDLAGGQPTMKGGLPVFNLGYLAVPGWFAPGLVAAIRSLAAIGLTYGFVRSLGLSPQSALVGGVAYAFCGFMVSWMNWPHSSVAAMFPGLMWAVERLIRDPKLWRAVPIGAVVAAMVWSNFPQVTVYGLLAALVYFGFRLPTELRLRDRDKLHHLKSVLVSGLLAVLLSVLFTAPHLIGFSQYLDWADTSYRGWSSFGSPAGVEYLLTAVAPAIWGHGSFGPRWFGESGWNEPHAYVGFSVFLLALLGLVTGTHHLDKRCRSAVIGISAISGLGLLIAYIGGPLTEPLRQVAGDLFGDMARAKVLWNLGIAVGAAFGVERLVGGTWSASSTSLKRGALVAALLGVVLAVAYLPFGAVWFDAVTDEGVLRQVLAVSIVPALSAIAVAVLVLARIRGWLTTSAVGWALVAIVGYEMLSFMMPVHTVTERDRQLTATPAHKTARELLDAGQRLSGEGWTFFPSTNALFDIDDARGQLLKSPGYNALLRAGAPDSLTVGKGRATPTWPYLPFDTDIASPVWDAMAVGVWAQFPNSQPPGSVIEPPVAVVGSDPAGELLTASLSSPRGGLRAVLVEVVANTAAEIDVQINAAGKQSHEHRLLTPEDSGIQSFAFLGEDIPAATPVEIRLTSPSAPGLLLVAVEESGELAAGMVAGDDEFSLVRTGDVLLIERPNAAFVRLADAALVEAEPQRAAEAVASRKVGERSVVVDTDLGLPATPSVDAELEVVSVSRDRDRVETVVRTDRDAVVVISVSDYPGWSATVDGQGAEIVTADAAFMAVAVPEGKHLVTLTFRPQHLRVSLLLAALGIALAVGLLAVAGIRRISAAILSGSEAR